MEQSRFRHSLIVRNYLGGIVLIVAVIIGSFVTGKLWGGEPERRLSAHDIIILPGMTVAEYGNANKFPQPVLKEIFNLKNESELSRPVAEFNLSNDQLMLKTRRAFSEYSEEHSKNPIKFTIHFIISLLFLSVVFQLLRSSKITPASRKILYIAAIAIFGFGFNSNPSPMGPLRDTIALFGNAEDILHPRLFAILTFLALVVVANKFICSWVCQFGVLQDFLFRLNRNPEDNRGLIRQFKLPFVISNSVRIVFFAAISFISFFWAFNIIKSIDPFGIFDPAAVTYFGWGFIASLLVLSLLIYRPWCHLFCPFGLLGWLFEKISVYKIKVDYELCTACNECTESCPSDVMEAILKRDRVLPDCFACGTCITECPTHAISFAAGKRKRPPEGKFVGSS